MAILEIEKSEGFFKVNWRKKKNINLTLISELSSFFKSARQEKIPVILDIFSSRGAVEDLSAATVDEGIAKATINKCHELIAEILNFPHPVIAALSGKALGPAYELALASDYIVAEEYTAMGLPQLHLGLVPFCGGTQTLTRRVGFESSYKMVLGAKILENATEPWVDKIAKNSLKCAKELAKGNLIKKRQQKKLGNSSRDWFTCKKAEIASAIAWCWRPPEAFQIAKEAMWDGNCRNILIGGLSAEFRAAVAAFKTKEAEVKISDYLRRHGP